MSEVAPLNSPADGDTGSPTVSDARPATPGGGAEKTGAETAENMPLHPQQSATTKLEVRPVTPSGGDDAASNSSGKNISVRFEERGPEVRVTTNSQVARVGTPEDSSTSRSSRADGGKRVSAYPGRENTEAEKPRKTILRDKLQKSKFYHGEMAQRVRNCLHGKTFVLLMSLALFIALFLPEIWVLIGANSNIEIDIILTFVMFMFLFELVALSTVDVTYFLSFFWFMDILGTISMIFDISYMVGVDNTKSRYYTGGDGSTNKNNLMLLRAARAARVGARAGRLSRVLRILRFLPFLSAGKDEQGHGISASISRQLANLLATRVACLTIILVMVIPAFDILSFPQNDHSLQTWTERLDANRNENSILGKEALNKELDEMVKFFAKREYGPYMACSGVTEGDNFRCVQDLPGAFKQSEPPRAASSLKVHTENFAVGFNMHQPEQLEKGLAILNIFFIIGIMIFSGLALSNVVTELAVRPLERMLKTVRQIAEQVFKFSKDMMAEDEQGEGEEFDINTSTEMKLLEKVVAKLAIIADLQSGQNGPQIEEEMGDEDIGILNMMQGKDVVNENKKQQARRNSLGGLKKLKGGPIVQLEDAGVSAETYNSYKFNTLDLTKAQMQTVGIYIISRFHDEGEGFIHTEDDKATLRKFVEAAASEYPNNPFHNFSHATDVIHGVARMMRLIHTEHFLTELEQFSLLIAAIGHDIGHPGVNNGFLSEVGHELALQYNDLSPLENMHVSKLYNIIVVPETNVFVMLSKEQYKEVRKYCIETILHTDMMGHQGMVKDLQMLYQMNVEIFRDQKQVEVADRSSAEIDLFSQTENKMLVMDNILHSADVSNPCRVWEISYAWAQCVLEEFFSQGDQEKMLGVPVQFLNDRDKLNRPNSQIGFLEFMIAPFFAAQIRLFHDLHEYGDLLAINIGNWEEAWAKEVHPEEDVRMKVRARVDKVKANLEEAKLSSAPGSGGTNETNRP